MLDIGYFWQSGQTKLSGSDYRTTPCIGMASTNGDSERRDGAAGCLDPPAGGTLLSRKTWRTVAWRWISASRSGKQPASVRSRRQRQSDKYIFFQYITGILSFGHLHPSTTMEQQWSARFIGVFQPALIAAKRHGSGSVMQSDKGPLTRNQTS